MPDSGWDEAVRQALEAAPATALPALFVEHREDLAVETGADGEPRCRPSHWSGACAESSDGARLLYRSDPTQEQLIELALACAEDRPHPPLPEAEPRRRTPIEAPRLDAQQASGLIASLLVGAQRRLPRATFSASWVGMHQRVHVGTPLGEVATDTRSGRRLRLDARIERDGRFARAVAEATWRPEDDPHAACSTLVQQVVERVERRLEARPATAGPTTVVLAPGIGGVLVHELVGHAAEGDVVAAGESWLGEVGEAVASPELTVVDDPRRGRAAWRVDDEGVPAAATALIREGWLGGRLHDRRSASKAGVFPSGHGRRGSFREPVLPRMGCTFIAAGRLDARDLLQEVGEGVYVRRMESAQTDPRTGRALFRVTDADRIRRGRIEESLQPHLLAVEAGPALHSVRGVADDLAFDTCVGSCHREGQPLAISVGAPTICIEVMKVLI